MKFNKTILILVIIITIIQAIAFNEKIASSALYTDLSKIQGIVIKEIKHNPPYTEAYEIKLIQPLDHSRPEGEKFYQQIYLFHIDRSKPVVMETEGYSYSSRYKELGALLGANVLIVEHRFFGESKPADMRWEFLTVKQAAADHHRIVQIFKKIYDGKWISAGWSKGGQTALFHRRYYTDDVDVTVAYDAPLNFSAEDARIDRFFEHVGTQYCRDKLKSFQRIVLANRSKIMPLFESYVKSKSYSYNLITKNESYEYIVLEYPFSFWQYHEIECTDIPDEKSDAEEIFDHLKKVVAFSAYMDAAMNSAASYQFSTELGYYGYVKSHLEDLLKYVKKPDNRIFAPLNHELDFNPGVMKDIASWLYNYGDRVLYIYEEYDPWSATAVEFSARVDAIKIYKKKGNHFTFISSFAGDKRNMIISTLERWLNLKIK